MSTSKAYQAWIKTGYDLFAQEGHEGIQVERLARILDLNKSGFYHYFGDRQTYFEHLMKYHQMIADHMTDEIETIKSFDPDYLNLLIKNTATVLVHMQLVRNRHMPLFENTFNNVNYKIDRAVVPIWSAHLGIPNQTELALRYFEMIRDMFYSRVTIQNLNYEFLHNTASEAKTLIQQLMKNEDMSFQTE